MDLFFTESTHTYRDKEGNTYKSVSKLIERYEEKFDSEFWSKAKGIEKLIRSSEGGDDKWKYFFNLCKENYKDKAWEYIVKKYEEQFPEKVKEYQKIIKKEWKVKNDFSIIRGNNIHNSIERTINDSLGYSVVKRLDTYRVNTIKDITSTKVLYDANDLKVLKALRKDYNTIYKAFRKYIKEGYVIYSEIVTFSQRYKVSGTIDVPIINFAKKTFYIEDWKTNETDLHFISGYYRKVDGIKTDQWINKDVRLSSPIDNLQNCKGIKYSLQLSIYALLTEELTDFKCEGLHINHIHDNKVDRIKVTYYKKEALLMLKYNK